MTNDNENIRAIKIGLVLLAICAWLWIIATETAAETGCKAKCQQQQKRPPEARKTRYAVKQVQTIHIPTHIPEAHRRALMRMQPQFQRWAFTGFQEIRTNEANRENDP